MIEFIIETKEYCFLCLTKREKFSTVSSSIDNLSRYLKVDRRKVFNPKNPIPPHLLAKVEKSELKANLCDGCASINDKFLGLGSQSNDKRKFQIAEEIIKYLCEKMRNAEKTGLAKAVRKSIEVSYSQTGCQNWKETMDILEALRKDILDNCHRMLKRFDPRVKLKKLTNEDVAAEKRKLKDDYQSSQNIKTDHVKVNRPVSNRKIKLEADFGDKEHMDECSEVFIQRIKAEENDIADGTDKKTKTDVDKCCTINPKTGKHKCVNFSKEFSNRRSFHEHHKHSHLKKTWYKCKVCGRGFTHLSSMTRHPRNVHLHIRHACDKCEATFAVKTGLTRHQQRAHMNIRISCDKCADTFVSKTNLKLHQMAVHLKKRFKCNLVFQLLDIGIFI